LPKDWVHSQRLFALIMAAIVLYILAADALGFLIVAPVGDAGGHVQGAAGAWRRRCCGRW
jgi:hypothetical protein